MAGNLTGFVKTIKFFNDAKTSYKQLRKHLDEQPVGFPSTLSGVELRLLEEIFTPREAEIALNLTYRFESFDAIAERARSKGITDEELAAALEAMERKGCIFVRRRDGEVRYSLHPFVVGMFEARLKYMTPGFYLDTANYILQRYAFEYLTTAVPQMRVVPVDRSIDTTQNISTYDQVRSMVEASGDHVCITNCICKTSKDLVGAPCKVTDRREVCMAFNDYAEAAIRHGSARRIDKEEAFERLAQAEKDGLILIASTSQEPGFVCACCKCCCGVMSMISVMPRPADFVASNFIASLDPSTCKGCKKCLKRCQMHAIRFDEGAKRAVSVNDARCIGCGLCVATCATDSLSLARKPKEFVPPWDYEELHEVIGKHKKRGLSKAVTIAKAFMGRDLTKDL